MVPAISLSVHISVHIIFGILVSLIVGSDFFKVYLLSDMISNVFFLPVVLFLRLMVRK